MTLAVWPLFRGSLSCNLVQSITVGNGGYCFVLRILNGAHSFIEDDRISCFVKPTNGYKCKGHIGCVDCIFEDSFLSFHTHLAAQCEDLPFLWQIRFVHQLWLFFV